jgi:glycosyltransferase involved in cell wall biosynthesis
MGLTILSVAYPLAPVGPDAVGGAEQVLFQLDRTLVRAGHRSIVIATEDSRVAGHLLAVPRTPAPFDAMAVSAARERHRRAILAALRRWPLDLVHCHGVDCHAYLPPPGVPVLVSLHLPIPWYAPEVLRSNRPDTWLQCVSKRQHDGCAALPNLLPPIENGVEVPPLRPHARRNYALMLSRICPEKGTHLAIEAAKLADVPLLIAGAAFPYEAHQRYFAAEVQPRLDNRRRFLGAVGSGRKRRLLAGARCLLVPSLAPETSSLVAREALALGAPVVAFPSGALADIVEDGRTGFLVRDVADMAAAIRRTDEIAPEHCRAVARQRFSLERMTRDYLALYERLSRAWVDRAAVGGP